MEAVTYAGFWRRLGAGLVDTIVFVPAIVLYFWLSSLSRTTALLVIVPNSLLYFSYEVYFHWRFGQTLGKMAAGIRVLSIDGASVSLRQAVLRSSVDFVFAVLVIAGGMVALARFPDAEYSQTSWLHRQHQLTQLRPAWSAWVSSAQNIWVWSEVMTVLFNRKKRAIHDFIAGTVVLVQGWPRPDQVYPPRREVVAG